MGLARLQLPLPAGCPCPCGSTFGMSPPGSREAYASEPVPIAKWVLRAGNKKSLEQSSKAFEKKK